ncbi:MAG: hypothetical protein IKA36_00335 [Clostridia bacterium]|nr:hypothetical protein [Clostridia bacterium]
MQIDRNEYLSGAKKVAKRITITMFACIPVLILFGYFTRNIITNRALIILCFVAIMGLAVLIEELIARRIENKKSKEPIVETKKDVFK